MERISEDGYENLTLFGSVPKEKKRGDFLKEFSEQTGYPIAFVAKKLQGLNTLSDMYYLQSSIKERLPRCKNYKHSFDTEVKIMWSKSY